jgi:phage-related protein
LRKARVGLKEFLDYPSKPFRNDIESLVEHVQKGDHAPSRRVDTAWQKYHTLAMKVIEWVGDSLDALREFPDEAKTAVGYALQEVQNGMTPLDAKPLKGKDFNGVYEIVEDFRTDTYRAVYIAKLKNAVYVLHCFQKKSKSGKKTPAQDIELIRARLRTARKRDKDQGGPYA